MADSTINLKLSGLKEIKKELKELQYDLSQATDPKQMQELAERAGELQDNLNRANEQARVFSAGSPFEKSSNALGLMGSQLASMDFEGAAESAKLFAGSLKSISPAQISTQLKGLVSMVGTLSKAFISFGLSLLANPIFLIAAAIAALVAIILVVMNKLGILKPILKAIGEVFKYIMKVVDGLIAAFEELTDWLGLTANAAEDSAERQNAALEKTSELRKKHSETAINGMNHTIALMKIEGKDVAIAEAQKLKYIHGVAAAEQEDLKRRIDNHTYLGDLSDEELNKLKESLSEQTKAMRDASQSLEILRAENKKKVEDNAKKVHEGQAKDAEKRAADAKAYDQDRINAARLLRDLELELMEDSTQKELAKNQEKYKRLIEDTQKNEKLLASEKLATIALLKEEEFAQTKAINQKQDEELALSLQISRDKKLAAEVAAEQKRNDTMLAISNELAIKQKENATKALDQEKAYKDARLNLGSSLVVGLKGLDDLLSAAGVKTAGLQKTIALVQIATDTAKAISAVIAGAAAASAAGGPAAPFLLAGYIATGIGTVLSAVASAYTVLKKAPPLGGSVSGSAPTATSVSAATPQTNLFGSANQGNNVSSPKDVESGQQQMIVKAVVVESDITQSQNHVNKLKQNAFL